MSQEDTYLSNVEDEENASVLPPLWKVHKISSAELRAFQSSGALSVIAVSYETFPYLTKRLPKDLYKMCPLRVPGDGNCLLHAISYALWGGGYYQEELRRLLKQEMTTHRDWYKTSVEKIREDDESQDYKDEEYDVLVQDASSTHAFLGFIHIFALSNILKRPIIVYAGDDDIEKYGIHEEGCAGTFLPTRHGANACAGPPIALAWSNEKKNHFVPLIPVEGALVDWPILDIAFKKTLAPGDNAERYIQIGNDFAEIHWREEEGRKKEMEKKLREYLQGEKNGLSSSDNIKFYYVNGQLYAQVVEEDEEVDDSEKEYDMVLSISVKKTGHHAVDQIGYNFDQDPYDVAERYIRKNGFPVSKAELGKWIKTRVEAYKNDPEKMARGKQRFKTFYETRDTTETCQYIPFSHPYNVLTQAQFKHIFPKIIQINNETCNLNKSLALTQEEIKLLEELVGILEQFSTNFSEARFNNYALDLVPKMLRWPIDKVFPAIDLARVLILHKSAAKYYLLTKNKHGMEKTIFGLMVKLADKEELSFNNRFLSLKFILNLFHQPAIHPLLLQYQLQIVRVIEKSAKNLNYQDEQNFKIVDILTNIFTNFSKLWQKGNRGVDLTHRSALKHTVELLVELLSLNPDKKQILAKCLVAVGTILKDDARIIIPKSRFAPYKLDEDAQVKECARFIIHLLDSPVVCKAVEDEDSGNISGS